MSSVTVTTTGYCVGGCFNFPLHMIFDDVILEIDVFVFVTDESIM
jgi:NADH:ubiquinone oxidoreductase subunit E